MTCGSGRAHSPRALLSPETQRQRLDATVPMNPQESAFYGLGIFNAGGWIGHSGSIFGYQTVAVYLPQTQTTLVFFINTDVSHQASTTLANAITNVISPDHTTADKAQAHRRLSLLQQMQDLQARCPLSFGYPNCPGW